MALIQASGPGPQYANNTLGGGFSSSMNLATQWNPQPNISQVLGTTPQNTTQNTGGTVPQGTTLAPVPSGQTSVPSPDLGMFDQLIAPALQSLESGVGAAQSSYDAANANTNALFDKQIGTEQANTAATSAQLKQRQAGAEQTTGNAINEARKGFSELAQGIQSRYGGATGTGAFAEGILGGQTQKNVAGYRQQLAQAIQVIGDTMTHVKMVGDQALQDLEARRQATLQDNKAKLDNAIAQIRANQSQLQSKKAELVASAISQYQQAVYQANNLANQYAQTLAEQQQAAQQRLAYAAAAQKQKADSLQFIVGTQTQPMGFANLTQGTFQPVGSFQGGNLSGQPDTTQGIDTTLLTPEEKAKYGIQ